MPLLDKPASKITSEICDDVKGFSNRLFDVLKNTESMEHELNLHRKVKTEVVGLLQEFEILTSTCVNLSNGTILSMQEELMTSRKRMQEVDVSANGKRAKEIKHLKEKNANAEKDLTLSLKREKALKIELTKLKKKNESLENELLRQKRLTSQDMLTKFKDNNKSMQNELLLQQTTRTFQDLRSCNDDFWSSANTPHMQGFQSCLPVGVVCDSSHDDVSELNSDNELNCGNRGVYGSDGEMSAFPCNNGQGGNFLEEHDLGYAFSACIHQNENRSDFVESMLDSVK